MRGFRAAVDLKLSVIECHVSANSLNELADGRGEQRSGSVSCEFWTVLGGTLVCSIVLKLCSLSSGADSAPRPS